MAILRPTKIEGSVLSVLINGDQKSGIETKRVDQINVSYEGFDGDWHTSLVRPSCIRTRKQYPDDTEIRNTRQISIVSEEDCLEIAQKMGLATLEPEWFGANLLLKNIPNFTLVPPSSRLIFSSGASLVVDMENEPCKYPGDVIEKIHPGFGKLFAKAALNLRGITAWVEREGMIKTGDSISLHIPPQRIYEI